MQPDSTEFNIRPNASFPRESWRWLLLALVIVSLGLAIRLALLGFWMILPFTILDLVAVALIVRMVRSKANYIERIRIHDDSIDVMHIETGKDAKWTFPLLWAQVQLRAPRHPWYPRKLVIGSSGKWVEVGQCLTDEERLGLADAVRNAIQQGREHMRGANA